MRWRLNEASFVRTAPPHVPTSRRPARVRRVDHRSCNSKMANGLFTDPRDNRPYSEHGALALTRGGVQKVRDHGSISRVKGTDEECSPVRTSAVCDRHCTTFGANFLKNDITERMLTKFSAPAVDRRQPETFWRSLTILISRSAWLLSEGTAKFVAKRSTSSWCGPNLFRGRRGSVCAMRPPVFGWSRAGPGLNVTFR